MKKSQEITRLSTYIRIQLPLKTIVSIVIVSGSKFFKNTTSSDLLRIKDFDLEI